MTKSEITEYVESGHAVDRWADTAVARYDWSMAWIQDSKANRASGQELFVVSTAGHSVGRDRIGSCSIDPHREGR